MKRKAIACMIHLIGLVLGSIIKPLYLKGFPFYYLDFGFHYIILGNMMRIVLIMVSHTQPKSKCTRMIGDCTLGHGKGITFHLQPFLLETDMIVC